MIQWQKIVDAAAKLAALIDLVNALFGKWRGESGPWDDADEAEASKLLSLASDARKELQDASSSRIDGPPGPNDEKRRDPDPLKPGEQPDLELTRDPENPENIRIG